MFLTEPQSSHYEAARFQDLSPRANHFDWELYYRFKNERERFWFGRMDTHPDFRRSVEEHFTQFQQSMDETLQLLGEVKGPSVLDVGLSSEQLDRTLIERAKAELVILDVREEAARFYERIFCGRGSFVQGDVISFAADENNRGRFDMVYSVGLIEHFPDKADILSAHVRLVKPGGLLLIYVPIDTEDNRRLTGLAAEWENFGYRELVTPEELRRLLSDPQLEILSARAVGFFAAAWARKKHPPSV